MTKKPAIAIIQRPSTPCSTDPRHAPEFGICPPEGMSGNRRLRAGQHENVECTSPRQVIFNAARNTQSGTYADKYAYCDRRLAGANINRANVCKDHPSKGMSDETICAGKLKSDSKLFLYKGQEVVQVVEELMEQTCILKRGLQDMIENFKNKICDCKPKERKADKSKRRASSDSCISASKISEVGDDSMPPPEGPAETTQVRLRAGQTDNSSALIISAERTEASFLSKQTEIEQKLLQVQTDLEQLRHQMSLFSSCSCKTKAESPQTSESILPQQDQLLGKADEIKETLIGMQADCCEQLLNQLQLNAPVPTEEISSTKTSQNEMDHITPDYTNVSTQNPDIETARGRQENIQMSNSNEAVRNKYDAKQNIRFKTKPETKGNEGTANWDNHQRKSACLADKTTRADEKAYREVNTVTEKDVTYPEARIIRTSTKTVRTAIVEGSKPSDKIVTNIRIKRTINNRTGEVKEVIYEGDDLSEVDESEIELLRSIKVIAVNENNNKNSSKSDETACYSSNRIRGGHNSTFGSSKLTPISSISSASLLLNKRNYDINENSPAKNASKDLTKASLDYDENPLFYNRQDHSGKGSKGKEFIRYVATNSEIQGGSLVGCKFGGNHSQSSGDRNELNLGGQTDSYFIELVNEQNKKTSQNGQRQLQNDTDYPSPPPSIRNSKATNPEVSIRSVDIDNIQNVIRQLSGNRPYSQFFISVLPEKHQSKNFRINVVDKESGNLLGYFYVDEEKLHQARLDGIFDNFLSLFVLNSLGSYNDFKTGINPDVLNKGQCFGE